MKVTTHNATENENKKFGEFATHVVITIDEGNRKCLENFFSAPVNLSVHCLISFQYV
jgi:hypothetical protein